MKIGLTGDVMLGRLVAETINLYGPDYPFGNTAKVLSSFDLAAVNLECVISDIGRPIFPKTFHFRAPPGALETLKNAGISFVTLANNHVLDYDISAFLDMLERLKKADIPYTGAGRNLLEAQKPVVSGRVIKIGVLAVTDNEERWSAIGTSPGIWFIPVNTEDLRFNELINQIKEVKKRVNFLIVSAHVGEHFREKPNQKFVEFAHAIIDGGADCYWGHSNHAFQGIEIFGGKPILYDTGDFVDDYAVEPVFRNDRSFIFVLNLKNSKVRSLELIPTQIENFQVNLATREAGSWAISRMQKLCRQLSTKTQLLDNSLKIDISSNGNF